MLEVGIGLACVTMLAVGVLMARGFINSSKADATVQSVKTLQRYAFAWSERVRFAKGYGGGSDADKQLSMENLSRAGLITKEVTTGWGENMTIRPFPLGVTTDEFEITFCVPNTEMSTDMTRLLNGMGLLGTQAGPCKCSTCQITVVSN